LAPAEAPFPTFIHPTTTPDECAKLTKKRGGRDGCRERRRVSCIRRAKVSPNSLQNTGWTASSILTLHACFSPAHLMFLFCKYHDIQDTYIEYTPRTSKLKMKIMILLFAAIRQIHKSHKRFQPYRWVLLDLTLDAPWTWKPSISHLPSSPVADSQSQTSSSAGMEITPRFLPVSEVAGPALAGAEGGTRKGTKRDDQKEN
jgi:hypothetical protein